MRAVVVQIFLIVLLVPGLLACDNNASQNHNKEELEREPSFTQGEVINDSILVGKDGWLFLTKGKNIENWTGQAAFTDAHLTAWLANIHALQKEVESQGGYFVVMVAPNKNTIYPEKMPSRLIQGSPTRLQQIEEKAKRYGINFISPVTPLQNAKAEFQTYNKLDAHWSQRGAFVAYQLIMKNIRTQFPDIDMLSIQDMEPFEYSMKAVGFSKLLGLDKILHEPSIGWRVKLPQAGTGQRLAKYQHGNFDLRLYQNREASPYNILILGDSFALSLLPYFAESFTKTVFVHHKGGRFDRKVFAEYPSDIVVLIIVERQLQQPWRQPKKAKQK